MTDTQGKLLIAPPNMPDWRFRKSVVYMWRHDVGGAGGVIINKKCTHPTFQHVCKEGGMKDVDPAVNPPVYYGGPVLTNLIGVLHTKEIMLASSNSHKDQEIAFTLDKKMLELVAQGKGPKKSLITLGLANWDQGQLEGELDPVPPKPQTMSWLVLPYDEKIVFGPQTEDLWEECVNRAVQNKTSEITDRIFKN